jgi:hypothetical protein
MEAAWLAAAAAIPLFFNISSFQIYELQKMCVLRFLVIVSSTAWLLAPSMQQVGNCLNSNRF